MASYAPLFPLEKQFQAKSGRNNTGGWLKVYLAATDDPADTYSDYLGTRNPEKIVLDDNGRAIVICDKARAYRLEVYDISGALLWTEEPLYCSGTGGGGVSVTRVVSTDGSINVESSTQGSTVVYDIGMAPPDSDEFLEWIKCSEEDCGATWKPVWQAGTMETEAGQGIKVHAGRLYHFTCSFTVDPDGTGVNYDTFHVNMYCGSTIVESRSFDIDSSLTDEVLCEFSHDLIPEEDGCVYFTLTIPSTCEVAGEVQVHRIYSGINAVPDTCATKQWVQETFDYNMSGRIPYSALGYNGNSEISGINGSSIAGGTDTTAVSAIAQTYAQSAVSGFSAWTADMSSISAKADQSALENCCSSVQSALSGKVDNSSYSSFTSQASSDISGISSVVSGITGDWSSKLDASASSEFYLTSNPAGYITGVDLTPYQLTADMSAYQPSGDYAYNSAVSSKLEESAFTAYTATALTGIQQDTADISAHVSGLTGQYVEKSAISAESAQWNNVSAKLDASASSNYYTTANESGYVDSAYVESQVSGKQDASAMTAYQPSGDYAYNSAVSAKLDKSASSNFYLNSNPSAFISGVTTDSSMTGDGSVASPLGVERVDMVFDSSMKTSVSGDSAVIGVNESALNLSSYQRVSAMTAYQPVSGMSAYQLSGDYYSGSNPSGFITGVDLSPYAYQSSLSSKLDASASSSFLPASSSADLFTGVHTDSSLTGNGLSSSPLGVERVDLVFTSGITTSISGDSALVYLDSAYMSSYAKNSALSSKLDATASASFQPSGNYQPSGDYAYNSALTAYQPVSGMTAYAPSGDYADSSALDLKLDASASSSFYTTANESGFVDSAYVDSAISGKADSSALTAYQEVTGMSAYQLSGDYAYNSALSAYQPSGEYIYASALGTGEI